MTQAPTPKAPDLKPFSRLASVYDDIMSDVDYDDWAEFMIKELQKRGWQTGNAPNLDDLNLDDLNLGCLDLGCGTGNSTFPMYARGLKVTGLDASADMLHLAKEKLPPVTFLQADFTDFDLKTQFGLIYSVFDSLNNLLSDEAFLKMAACVYTHLANGGFFMFDANTTEGLKYLWESGRAEGYINDVHYCWEHSFDEHTGLAKVEAYCEKEGQAFTEIHTERAYDVPQLEKLLAQVGFSEIEALTYPEAQTPEENEPRVWMIARKYLAFSS